MKDAFGNTFKGSVLFFITEYFRILVCLDGKTRNKIPPPPRQMAALQPENGKRSAVNMKKSGINHAT
jgi:hypothetical protein